MISTGLAKSTSNNGGSIMVYEPVSVLQLLVSVIVTLYSPGVKLFKSSDDSEKVGSPVFVQTKV